MKVETCHTKAKPVSTHQGLVNHDDTDGADDVEHPSRRIRHNLVPRLASWRRTHAPISTREPSPIQVSEHLSTESPARESIRAWQWHQQQNTQKPQHFLSGPRIESICATAAREIRRPRLIKGEGALPRLKKALVVEQGSSILESRG